MKLDFITCSILPSIVCVRMCLKLILVLIMSLCRSHVTVVGNLSLCLSLCLSLSHTHTHRNFIELIVLFLKQKNSTSFNSCLTLLNYTCATAECY